MISIVSVVYDGQQVGLSLGELEDMLNMASYHHHRIIVADGHDVLVFFSNKSDKLATDDDLRTALKVYEEEP